VNFLPEQRIWLGMHSHGLISVTGHTVDVNIYLNSVKSEDKAKADRQAVGVACQILTLLETDLNTNAVQTCSTAQYSNVA
jgi:hypothetical protein